MSLSSIARAGFALAAFSLIPLRASVVQDSPKGPAGHTASDAPNGAPKSAPKATDDESTIASLIPSDAFCVIRIPSLEGLASTIKSVQNTVAPDSPPMPDLDMLLSMQLEFPGKIELIDHKKPLAVCISFAKEGFEPVPTFILPVTSRDEYLKSLEPAGARPDGAPPMPAAPKSASLGDYVGVSHLAKYAVSDPPNVLGLKMMPGVLSTRIDLERLFETTRPMIEPILDQAKDQMTSAMDAAKSPLPGFDPSVMVQSYIDGFRTFMDSAETLDLALSMQGERTDLSVAFTALEKSALADLGSKEKTSADQLAKCLDPDAPFSVVLGMDIAAMAKRYQPLLDGLMTMYPESMRGPMAAAMAGWRDIYPLLGTGLALSGDMTPTGVRATCYFRSKDPKALLEQLSKVMKDFKMPGITVKPLEPATVDGIAVTQIRLDIDAKALSGIAGDKADPEVQTQIGAMVKRIYGENGIRMTYATKGDMLVQVVGGDDAYVRRALTALGDASRKAPREMQPLVDRVAGSNPCFVSQFDIARYLSAVMEQVAAMSGTGEADKSAAKKPVPSAPILFHGGIDGRVWRGGASWELARVATAMKQVFNDSPAGSKTGAARGGKVAADIYTIERALKDYAMMNGGKYPDSLQVLVVLDSNGRKFLESKTIPLDPWGREYLYDPPTPQHPEPRVYTYGKDGKPGGEGDDADIDNASLRAAGK